MTSSVWQEAHALARWQDGVVTRRQLYDAGVPERTLTRRIAAGDWIRRGGGVLLTPGTPDSLATRSRIAALRVPRAVLTGPSAATLTRGEVWQGTRLGMIPWLIHPRRSPAGRYLSHPGIRTRRVGPWVVACATDAIVDMLRFLPPNEARTLAYRSVQCRVLTVDQLAASAHSLVNCAGNPQLRSIVDELAIGVRSEAERLLVQLIREAGLSGWQANHRVMVGGRRFELDLAFPAVRLAIEVDGFAFHSAHEHFVADRRRQNHLVGAGWTVLRFTWDDLTNHPQRTVALIAQSLQRLS